MKTIDINKHNEKIIQEELGTGEVCLLLGSAVSDWNSGQLISGKAFSENLKSIIFKDSKNNYIEPSIECNTLNEIYRHLPFEIVNNLCPNHDEIKSIIYELYNVYQPNLLHEIFAGLLLSNRITSIITTNYDNCLEGAIKKISERIGDGPKSISLVITRESSENLKGDPVLFKIHGSASSKGSIIFDITQEGILQEWKRQCFQKLIYGKTLVIIGYSGIDFDICQEIPLGKPRKILWNFYKEENITSNPKLLEKKVNLTTLIGDMKELIPILFKDEITRFSTTKLIDQTDISNSIQNLKKTSSVPKLADRFSNEEKRIWQLKVLNMLCYVQPVINLSQRLLQKTALNTNFAIEILSEFGGALAPNGKYKTSGEKHLQALKIALKEKQNKKSIIRHLSCASDAFRGNGRFLLAGFLHLWMNNLIRHMKQDQDNNIYLIPRNQILLLREFYRIAKLFHLQPIMNILRNFSLTRIKSVYEKLKKDGNYYNLQQLQLWAKKYDISESDLYFSLDIEIPPADTGYEQLYFPLGMMMAFRDNIYQRKSALHDKDYQEARDLIRLAQKLELNPEIWKLLRLIKKYFPKKFDTHDKSKMIAAFESCEYTFLQKIIKKGFGS